MIFSNLKSISKILLNMKQSKIKPNAETFTAVMCAYAKRNNIDRIKEQISTCDSSNIHLSNENIFNVIYTLAANNYTQHIDTVRICEIFMVQRLDARINI